MQSLDVIIALSLISFFGLAYVAIDHLKKKKEFSSVISAASPKVAARKSLKKESLFSEPAIYETFDYFGIKIFNNNGTYLVEDGGVTLRYGSFEKLPVKYCRMLVDMDKQKFDDSKSNYYLESTNGSYFIRMPDGQKLQFKNYKDIPDNLKKLLA